MRSKHKTIDAHNVGEFVGKVSAELMILGAVATALAAALVDILR